MAAAKTTTKKERRANVSERFGAHLPPRQRLRALRIMLKEHEAIRDREQLAIDSLTTDIGILRAEVDVQDEVAPPGEPVTNVDPENPPKPSE